MSASATDELFGGSPAVAKDGAGKEGGGLENGTTAATPEAIVSRAPPRAHFFYSMANTVESDKPRGPQARAGVANLSGGGVAAATVIAQGVLPRPAGGRRSRRRGRRSTKAWRHGVDEAALGLSGSPRRAGAERSGGARGDARAGGEYRRNRRVAACGGANEVSGILAGRAEDAGEKPQHVAWHLHDRGCSPFINRSSYPLASV